MNVAASGAERFIADFATVARELPGARHSWLGEIRRQALEQLGRMGLPTVRDEAWRYTSIAPIEKRTFRSADGDASLPSVIRADDVRNADGHLMVFVNGRYAAPLSALEGLPGGVTVTDLAVVLAEEPERVADALRQTVEAPLDGFAALNAAFTAGGAYVNIDADTVLDRPLELLFISHGAVAAHPRVILDIAPRAQLSIVESYAAVGEAETFCNAVTQVRLGDGARLEHCKVLDDSKLAFHVGKTLVDQGADSVLVSDSVSLGAMLARHDIRVELREEGAAATLNGLYLVGGRQHVDHHTCIEHRVPRTTSSEFYRGVLSGAARGVFNGRVVVHPGANRISAEQSNHNLLLSRNAEIDTKPELEIYADDVQCSHGATVGQLDTGAIFYLRSRGIAEESARRMLTYAFAADVIARIGVPAVRQRLTQAITGQLLSPERLQELL